MKKLILVDDHKLLRKGISSFIQENSDWKVFAEAESEEEISEILKKVDAVSNSDTTVAVVDIQLKSSDDTVSAGFRVVKRLLERGIPSVVFSSHDTGACIERAVSSEVGAKGFVSKLSDERMLLDAINSVAAGKTYIQPDLITSFMETHSLLSMLSKREYQVLKCLQDGLDNNDIADCLGIKTSTVENYITQIYDKTGTHDKKTLLEKII